MTTKTGDELRALAAAIERAKSESPIASIAQRIVGNCVEHLRAVARIHDLNSPRHD
jgi:hypothetical protein